MENRFSAYGFVGYNINERTNDLNYYINQLSNTKKNYDLGIGFNLFAERSIKEVT